MSKTGIYNSLGYEAVLADTDAFSQLIKDHGVTLQHYKAVTCPLGLIGVNDVIASHSAHVGCENGFIYQYAGDVTVYINNNSAVTGLSEVGILDGSIVSATFPVNYDNNTNEVYVQLYDRFFVRDLAALTPNTQLIEAHPSGWDKANYFIRRVEYIIDSNNVTYTPDLYEILDGKIHWKSNKRPGFDPQVGKGVVFSVRYLYSPYFYVSKLMHEVRLLNKIDFVTNEKTVVRAPYAALLNREYYQYKQQNNIGTPGTTPQDRELLGPRDSIWGPH